MKKIQVVPAQHLATEIRVVVEPGRGEPRSLSVQAMLVAIVAVIVTGSVAAATIYGAATQDYSLLKGMVEAVINGIHEVAKAKS